MLLFCSQHLALNSPLGHFNGDQFTPLHQTHKNHGDSKDHFPPTATWLSLNYSEHNPSHVQRHMVPSQPSNKSISSPYHLFTHNLSTSPAAQTETTFSMLQIKPIPKNTFQLSAYYFIIPLFTLKTISERPYTLSEETTQRKHTHIRHNSSSLNKNKFIAPITTKSLAKSSSL